MASAVAVIDKINTGFMKLHQEFEDEFWATKMDLKGNSVDSLSEKKSKLESFLQDKENLKLVSDCLSSDAYKSEDEKVVLAIMKKTFEVYSLSDESAKQVKDEINKLEAVLGKERKEMKLGYTDPHTKEFVEMSSVQLRNKMRSSDDEQIRKACYEGLVSIGDSIAEKLCQVVKLRNKSAKLLGYEDFYDMNVTRVEGFNKKKLFEILDGLETQTKETLKKARNALKEEKGTDTFNPLEPWNVWFSQSGSIESELDPYFPFHASVQRWGKSFSKLGINYRKSQLNLDLLDRKGKYSNGFCHWPIPAHREANGKWVPSKANFTSLASPGEVGSGKSALRTLLHEGGHAAHFANCDPVETVGSPMFSQETAPTSVAYAENQSMFLDKLLSDSDWLAKYATNEKGEIIPWELVEKNIKSVHPYSVFGIRSMLKVPYFEKALYEMKDEDLNPESLKALAKKVELEINDGPTPLPVLSIPHILAGESCCYYHGYVLADMSVYQTREYFLEKYGFIADNEKIGPELTKEYWKPGNSISFLDLVSNLTGKPLTADAWIRQISQTTEEKLTKEKEKYDRGIKEGKDSEDFQVHLDMELRIVHGDLEIANSSTNGGFEQACKKFKVYLQNLQS